MHGRPCPKELSRELGLEPLQVKLFRQREKGRATDELETNNSEAKRPVGATVHTVAAGGMTDGNVIFF